MTSEQLSACSKKKLEALAKREGIAGWKALRKDELVVALAKLLNRSKKSPSPATKVTKPATVIAAKPKLNGKLTKTHPQRVAARDTSSNPSSASLLEQRVERSKYETGATKDGASKAPALPAGYQKDRIVAMVRDPFWLHVYWEITNQSVERAESALGQDWHGAKRILRVLDVSANETTSTAERLVRDIEVQPGCANWYVEVRDSKSYRIDVGYVSKRGQFYAVTRSNVVNTPKPNASDSIDENWADIDVKSAERIFAMSTGYDPGHAPSSLELKELFEERMRRPLVAPAPSSPGAPAPAVAGKDRRFWFQLDAELIVYGATEPNARVTLQGEPVKLRPDGTFTMRFSLPDGRQIIPAVASSADGVEERTIVLAVERNTKQLEPLLYAGHTDGK